MLVMLTADHHHTPRPTPPSSDGSFLQMPLSLLTCVLGKQSATAAPATPSPANLKTCDDPALITPPGTPMRPDSGASTSPTLSRQASSSTLASGQGKGRKRASRPKTTYNLAQPPPCSAPRQKLHMRPKILLQLHQVVPLRHPKPVYEVIPYSILAPVSTRRLARTFPGREKLGANDLLIVKAAEYCTSDEEKSDDERWGARDVVGVICPGREEKGTTGRTEVRMENGATWDVSRMPNGGYDFCHTDEHGLSLKSRWIPKPMHIRRQASSLSASLTVPSDDRKFNFSTISAHSRRHPVIATMTRDRIDVLDSYRMPSATSPTPSATPSALATPVTPSGCEPDAFLDTSSEQTPVITDDALRLFIVASGIWVAFCEQWSPAYSYAKNACTPPSTAAPATTRPSHGTRSASASILDSPRPLSPGPAIDENKRTLPRILRSGAQLLHRNTSSHDCPDPSPAPPQVNTHSEQSNLPGAAEQKRPQSATKRVSITLEEDHTEAEEEKHGRSSADISRTKALYVPPSLFSTSSPNALTPIASAEDTVSKRSLSPACSHDDKRRSAYDPVPTAGLWDSGVVKGLRIKTRPTSVTMLSDKTKKAKRKESRASRRERKKAEKEEEKAARQKSEGLRHLFLAIFRKEKGAA